MKKFSIVIPVYNEEKFIGRLLESIGKINYPAENLEVIVVSDGSTDNTAKFVKKFPYAGLIELHENVGRYAARKTGAEAATYQNILFIDSRSIVDPNILLVLNEISEKLVIGHSLGKQNPDCFETFYTSIRRKIFSSFLRASGEPVVLNKDNFDSMPKGTTVLFVQKEILLNAYRQLTSANMGKDSSDDIKLLQMIVENTPGVIHPDVKITNFTRDSFFANIHHLFMRGAKFVDYYLDPTKKFFWLVMAIPPAAFFVILAGLLFLPGTVVMKLAFLLSIDLILGTYLSNSIRNFAVNIIMLPLATIIFYAGIIRGLIIQLLRIKS